MQIEMKFRATINIRASRKNTSGNNGNQNGLSASHICNDCSVELVKQQMEFICPKCGMVEELIDGSE